MLAAHLIEKKTKKREQIKGTVHAHTMEQEYQRAKDRGE